MDENGIRANIIASAYGKGNDGNINYRWYVNQVVSGNTLYWNKEKATAFFASAGVQFSLGAKNGSGFLSSSIKTEDDLVKVKMEKYASDMKEENAMNLNNTIANLRDLKDEALRLKEDMDYPTTLQIVAFCDRAIKEFSKVDDKYGPAFSAYTSEEENVVPSLALEDIATVDQQEKLMEKLARNVELYSVTFHPKAGDFATPEQVTDDKRKIAEFLGKEDWPAHLFTNAEISVMANRLEKERNSFCNNQIPDKPQLTDEQKVKLWNDAVAKNCNDLDEDFSIHPGDAMAEGTASSYGVISYAGEGDERLPYIDDVKSFDEAISALKMMMPHDRYQVVMQEMESAAQSAQEAVSLPQYRELDVPDVLDRINGAISKDFVQKLKVQQMEKNQPVEKICESVMNLNVLGKNNNASFNKWVLDEYKMIYQTFGSRDSSFPSVFLLDNVERRCADASKPENATVSMGIADDDRQAVSQFASYVSGAFDKAMEQRRNMQELTNGKYESFTRPIVKFLKATGMDEEKILNVFDGMKRTAEKLLGKSKSATR